MSRLIMPALAALALSACGSGEPADQSSNSAPASVATEDSSQAANTEAVTAGAPDEPAETAAASVDNTAVLAGLGDAYLVADLQNGARQFRRCQACHTLDAGGRHTVGPNLHGTVNAAAAGQDGFSYSRQLRESGLVWDAATLDAWLENPRSMIPGNRMSFVGLRDAEDRRDVIAYIAVETAG